LPFGCDAQLPEQVDSYSFELADVVADSEAQVLEVQDGVKDELAWVVGGCSAAPAYFNYVDAAPRQLISINEELIGASAGAERNDGGVFDYQDGVGDFVAASLFAQFVLTCQNFTIIGQTTVDYVQRTV
jgi:hypothetical protein